MLLDRRTFMGASTLLLSRGGLAAPRRMGIVIHSYGQRRFADPGSFLEYCAKLQAGGIQIGLGGPDTGWRKGFRQRAETLGMSVEGMVRLPRGDSDLDRFRAEVRGNIEAGATVARTVALSERRYEKFSSLGEFKEFARQAERSLQLAEAVARQEKLKLAVENHKDWRIDELVPLLERLASPYVGVCLDTGNSIALLEDPHEVAKAYAPWTITTHFKDMAVAEHAEGFLLSEVPLGTGLLDLKKIVELLPAGIAINLEMITRDPLKVPCLTSKYWETMPRVSGAELAKMLSWVRKLQRELPTVASLSSPQRREREEENVQASQRFARGQLGF